MPEIIRNGRVERDDWRFLDLPGASAAAPVSDDDPQFAAERVAVPLAAWLTRREQLLRNLGSVGVWLGPADDPTKIASASLYSGLSPHRNEKMASVNSAASHTPTVRDGLKATPGSARCPGVTA